MEQLGGGSVRELSTERSERALTGAKERMTD